MTRASSTDEYTAVILLPGTEPLTAHSEQYDHALDWLAAQYVGLTQSREHFGECHALIIDGGTDRAVAAWHGPVGHIADELAEAIGDATTRTTTQCECRGGGVEQ